MTILVSGASSGLGYHTACAAVQCGHTVIAGARSFAKGEKDGMYTYPLDVTDADSISAFADYAKSLSSHIDAVIHCAGILILGSTEETTVEAYQKVLDTDFLGMVRLNQALLPLFRAQKAGRIMVFSSINGLLGIPFQSAYTAAKHAVEGYAECLAMETHDFGVQVCLIEPGDHRSGSQHTRLHANIESGSPYAAMAKKGTDRIHWDETHGSDPAKLGRKVISILEKRHMPMRRCIAKPDQHLAVVLHDLLPGRLNSWILRRYYLS
ncbi:MAG: SDR family oxidoreductase [Clostridia bacterium]|nr:SDR family oxidoreductase [Clostridia bacterium]